jgi:nitroreductase
MEFSEPIHARRSVGGYESGVDHGELAAILREAQQAPSRKNRQTSRCYAAESPEALGNCAKPFRRSTRTVVQTPRSW